MQYLCETGQGRRIRVTAPPPWFIIMGSSRRDARSVMRRRSSSDWVAVISLFSMDFGLWSSMLAAEVCPRPGVWWGATTRQ